MKIRKGDTVKVLYGKDRDRRGKVLKVLKSKQQVIVDGLNVYKKHVKGDGRNTKSEVIFIIKPLSISKLMLICDECGRATRVGMREVAEGMVRFCKKCGKQIGSGDFIDKVDEKNAMRGEKKKGGVRKGSGKSKKKVKIGIGRNKRVREESKKRKKDVSAQVIGDQKQQRSRMSGDR